MNGLGILFLVALLVTEGLVSLGDLLNLRGLRDPPPPDFLDLYDPATYERSQRYARERERLALLARAVDLAALLAFWLSGGFGWWDRVVGGLGWGTVPSGMLYIAGLLVARSILSLPFGVYSTFGIERRYGFNRTTLATFAADMAKGLALGAVLGGSLLAASLYVFEHAGNWSWLILWTAGVVLSFALQIVLPIWIMPLFNRFTPLEDGELRTELFAYAGRIGFPLESVYVVDGSRRSTKANAFFTGFGRHKRIGLFDTLLQQHTVPEVLAVLGHEMGHYLRRHVLIGTVVESLYLGLRLWLVWVLIGVPSLYTAFKVAVPSVHAGLLLALVFLGPLDSVLSPFLLALSRRHEADADMFAAQTAGGPGPLASAFRRMAADTLANLTPAPLHVFLTYSHPPLTDRVRRLSALPPT